MFVLVLMSAQLYVIVQLQVSIIDVCSCLLTYKILNVEIFVMLMYKMLTINICLQSWTAPCTLFVIYLWIVAIVYRQTYSLEIRLSLYRTFKFLIWTLYPLCIILLVLWPGSKVSFVSSILSQCKCCAFSLEASVRYIQVGSK